MRILTIHSNWLEFEPKTKALKDAEVWTEGTKRIDECLVAFVAVENKDENNLQEAVEKGAAEISKVADEVGTRRIVLYPYVHLVSSPASSGPARKALEMLEAKLAEKNYETSHAPFGWYKAFTISCKGHPLSELSREISVEPAGTSKTEDVISGALKAEEEVVSEWFVLDPVSEELIQAENFDFSKFGKLEKFYRYEIGKVRGVQLEPPHAKLMRSLELVDYEPGSDPGNLRWYPKGRLIKQLLEQWISERMARYGAMEVETPVMYDYEHPALRSYLDRFPARQYVIQSAKKRFFLRFSACFGQFLMKSRMEISYKDLPLKMYELTRYSFRLEKAGELVALRRLRAFTMPDMHTLCRDLESAKREFVNQFKLSLNVLADLGLGIDDFEMAFRCTKEFWSLNKEWVMDIAKILNKPILVEMWSRRYAYFDPKFEFNFVDSMDKASALSTVQIDHENASRFDIKYRDTDNSLKNPLILHCSASGALERVLYALLERAAMASDAGKVPQLPLWLSPTQVRLCAVSEEYVKDCEQLAQRFEERGIRADIDDRPETIQRKIRDAELEWIPYVVVFGEKERRDGLLAVRVRENGKIVKYSAEKLIEEIGRAIAGKPTRPLNLPKMLSQRPIFVGK